MNTLIITEVRIYKNGKGHYSDISFSKVIERYSLKFENITILTRIIDSETIPNGYVDISKNIKSFVNLGSIERYIFKSYSKQIRELVYNSDFIILRVPALVCNQTYKYIKKFNKKYMTESIGCAWDDYWNHGIEGKILAPYMFIKTREIIRKANYGTYVTEKFLQKRYPCNGKNINVSNVYLDKVQKPRKYDNLNKNNLTLFTAGGINIKTKGQQYVIKAMKKLKKDGINIKYYLAGKGDNNYLSKLAKKYGVEDNVFFLGMLSRDELFNMMRKTDIYIQPSLQEGLPRALIEAMSNGCFCLGSTTAGIPELLQEQQIFKRGSTNAIVRAIKNNLNEDFSKISIANIKKSKNYRAEILNKKRFDFYNEIINDLGY